MPITVKAQGKTFTFPDDTSNEDIGLAIDNYFTTSQQPAQPQQINPQGLTGEQLNRLEEIQNQVAAEQAALNQPLSAGQATMVGIGKGMTDVGRGVGNIVSTGKPFQASEAEQQAFEQLKQTNPVTSRVGEFVGETAATAPLGGLAGSIGKGAVTKVLGKYGLTKAGKVGTAIAGGAAEGAAVAAQLDEDMATGALIGGAAGAIVPVVFRAAGDAFRRLTGKTTTAKIFDETTGELTEQAAKELQDAGIPLETFSDEVKSIIDTNYSGDIDLAVQARAAQLQEFAPGAEARPSRLSQQPSAQAAEEQLIATGTPAGQRFLQMEQDVQQGLQQGARDRLLGDLNTDLIARFDDAADTFNLEKVGETVQVALNDQKAASKAAVDSLYKSARELTGEGQKLFTDDLRNVFELSANELAPSDGLVKAIGRNLKEYGVIKEGDELFEDFALSKLRPIKELTLDNAEELRKSLNKLKPTDPTDIRFVTQVKNALDAQVNDIIETFSEEGAVAQAFKEARAASANFKQTFADKEFVGRLIEIKNGRTTETIPAEKVLQRILNSSQKDVKNLKGVLLEGATPASRNAWNEIKFATIDDLMRKSVNKDSLGNPVLSGAKLNSAINKIGNEKLKLVLGNEKFNQLKRFQQVLSDQTIPIRRAENPSGSALSLSPVMNKIAELLQGPADMAAPGIGSLINGASKKSAQRKAISDAAKEISRSTGRTARAQAIKARNLVEQFLLELAETGAVSGAVVAGGQE